MKEAIIQIDRAIKALYRIDFKYCAEDFLVQETGSAEKKVANSLGKGALLFQPGEKDTEDLDVGIYFSPSVRETLDHFKDWKAGAWKLPQLQAFTVAVEEVSHYHCFLYHVLNKLPVKIVTLELQGEIDKFLVTYYAKQEEVANRSEFFDQLFEQLFEKFQLVAETDNEEKERYKEANDLAKQFILKLASQLKDPNQWQSLLQEVRQFYRQDITEKISYINGGR